MARSSKDRTASPVLFSSEGWKYTRASVTMRQPGSFSSGITRLTGIGCCMRIFSRKFTRCMESKFRMSPCRSRSSGSSSSFSALMPRSTTTLTMSMILLTALLKWSVDVCTRANRNVQSSSLSCARLRDEPGIDPMEPLPLRRAPGGDGRLVAAGPPGPSLPRMCCSKGPMRPPSFISITASVMKRKSFSPSRSLSSHSVVSTGL
mmetsp:Transcript_8498/g.32013  ORF Transcript_8498/g.32013 Transcript_8498/m.32013 type:complete len:205 (-) Transcript_8498:382-996(-)